jgi:hypothetical protein
MRERMNFAQRDRIEKVLIVIAILILLVDIGFSINSRRITASEINDCIRFYHEYPAADDSNYYFTSLCYNYFGSDGVDKLRKEGVALLTPDVNPFGNITIKNSTN